MPPALPPKKKTGNEEPRTYFTKLSDYIGKTTEEIEKHFCYSIYIDSIDLLKNNFDLVKKLISIKKGLTFYSESYECLKLFEEKLDAPEDVTLSLIDDFENKDRSYIDLSFFQKAKIEIPFPYILWIPQIPDHQQISLYHNCITLHPYCSNSYQCVSLEKLKKIRQIIHILSEQYKGLSDLEKVILISNYIQDHVQYVAAKNKSEASDGTYITDSKGLEITRQLVDSPENVLLSNFGLCNGIAHATTLLLNNPEMNVNTRAVVGGGHVWNVVLVDGKYYYIDNTWSITRNDDRYPGSLKARKFSSAYLLFGTDKARTLGHHIPESYTPPVEQTDLSSETLKDPKKKLAKVASFEDYQKPVFASRLEK